MEPELIFMGNKSVTIIIPTYNRKDVLEKCLAALSNQTYPKNNYEIIVIDDGSFDGTEIMMKSYSDDFPCPLKYFRQENKGPAAARNVGIKNASGQIILFTGDDIIAQPNFIEEHMKWHELYPQNNTSVLGLITWSTDIVITPFMYWLENGGPQFHYWKIKDKKEVDSKDYFYTSNISLKKNFLLESNHFFDEDFPYAAYEDIELGTRLKQQGLLLKYNKNAVGYHHHFTSLESFCQRMIKVGESRRIMKKKQREKEGGALCKGLLNWILCAGNIVILFIPEKICHPLAAYYEKKKTVPVIFECVTRYYLNIGDLFGNRHKHT